LKADCLVVFLLEDSFLIKELFFCFFLNNIFAW